MKKILLLTGFFLSLNSFGQILTQDFESATFPPTGWTTNTLVPTRPWGLVSSPPFLISGTQSAAVDWIAQNNTANLISPSFSLVGYSSANLSFNVKVGYSYMIAQAAGNLFARISTNGGAFYTTLWQEENSPGFVDDGDGDPDTDLYNTVAVNLNLSAYLGQPNVIIKFQYTANDADAVSVDDVVISGTLSNSDFVASKLSVYPNPVNNVVTVYNAGTVLMNKISITDINGRIVKTASYEGVSETQLNISDLNAGIYFMNIDTNEGIATKKIVKN